jgi:hypothetical protein
MGPELGLLLFPANQIQRIQQKVIRITVGQSVVPPSPRRTTPLLKDNT